MNALDEQTRASLERLVPRDPSPPAWDDVLARANLTSRARGTVRPRLLAGAAALVAAAIVVAFPPWQRAGHATLLDRALAAVGNEPVLHAVISEQTTARYELVDLTSGEVTTPEQTITTETWYDEREELGHTIARARGNVLDDTLQTRRGTWNMDGVVYTCAWIAAHPVEATREGVSCRFDGDNGTTPHVIPEAPPSVDPALAAFLTGYRDELASGRAHKVSEGMVDGRAVDWVQLPPAEEPPVPGSERPPGEPPPAPIVERVAIDRATYRPLLVRSTQGDVGRDYRVLQIETLDKGAADFSMPPRRPSADEPESGNVVESRNATPAEAAAALDRAPLWLGSEFRGLQLAAIHVQTLKTTYSSQSGLEPRVAKGVELVYGPLENDRPSRNALVVSETDAPTFALGWDPVRLGMPPAGSLLRWGNGMPFAWLKHDDVFVRLSLPSGAADPDAVAAARALTPMDR